MLDQSGTTRRAARLELDERVATRLRDRLPVVAERTVSAITAEVPGYSGALTGAMREKIENAVRLALGTFLQLIEKAQSSDPSTPLTPALEAAYALGSGEARSGRSMDALLAAYRIGARVAWREVSTTTVQAGLAAETVAEFAELMFAYIDELSAASVAGHADELASAGRVRRRYLERLIEQLLAGEPEDTLRLSAERADWPPPQTLTVVLLPRSNLRAVLALLSPHTLESGEDLPGVDLAEEMAVLLVPDMHGGCRRQLARVLHGHRAVLGPARPWSRVGGSYERATRALALGLGRRDADAPVDTEQHLAELVLSMDPEGLADLRAQALQPLASLPPATAHRLAETLRSWLLHQGRRDDVAAELFVHPQTVRYRMGKLRELYGDRLHDPATVLALTLALAMPPAALEG
ncbi:PucR C-terminal helix-turn-helix domain-containing protein [Micromonospora rhizosphaerae]|uniref:PucR C-terminal helix-turn-helix domain-containing protein n=1 Tax=Micromonospora rhizosphaerae TaxID=568872 RepID=A0A1C6SE92_9ACTN|nr:helix-turn-helix domain-containing protein [Micromonospora rhizosphaerae]SCL27649.1 PucR C-terminal helix-turn-helix domain-containing protein [Micromonospora rhizosphaerae]